MAKYVKARIALLIVTLQTKNTMTQQDNKKPKWLFLLILSGLMGCTTLSTDIYLPAMPVMEQILEETWS